MSVSFRAKKEEEERIYPPSCERPEGEKVADLQHGSNCPDVVISESVFGQVGISRGEKQEKGLREWGVLPSSQSDHLMMFFFSTFNNVLPKSQFLV